MAAGIAAAASAAPTGIANVIGADSWQSMQTPPYGMYSFSMEANPNVQMISTGVVPGNFGACYVDGKYFVIEGIATSSSSFITNYIYDAETWQKITDFRGENLMAFDMVWDETTGNVYGSFHNFDTNTDFFGTIDINTGETTSISPLPFAAYGLSCDVEGQLYGIAKDGKLYSINKTTGASTLIGNTGCSTVYSTTGAIDSSTRTFYYATCNADATTLYAINLDTAAATQVAVIPDEMALRGLYFPEPSALPTAPAMAEDVAFDFDGAALSGSLSFTVPATLTNGTAGSGSVQYTVKIDGVEKTSGSTQYGATVTVPLEFTEPAEHTAVITLRNATGSAPTARLKAWIGQDVPAPVGTVSLVYDGNGTFTVSWPEATSLHGGYFDPSTVTYSVQRYSSEEDDPTLFNGLTDNTMTSTVAIPGEDEYATYHFNVAAVFGSVTGSYTTSEYYTIGSLMPPFTEQFSQRWALGKFTIFEGSKKDYDRWSYDSSNKAVTVVTNTSTGGDDYLLLPPLALESNKKYTISFDAKGKYSSDTESFEVLAGMAPSVEALTSVVKEQTDFQSTTYTTYSMEFQPSTTGTWFIAIHAISAPYKSSITVDNINVSAGVEVVPPVPVGVDEIATDIYPAEYFTLQGLRVERPLPGSLVIERRGPVSRLRVISAK